MQRAGRQQNENDPPSPQSQADPSKAPMVELPTDERLSREVMQGGWAEERDEGDPLLAKRCPRGAPGPVRHQ